MIRDGFDVVENEHFTNGAATARKDAEALRKQLALPPRYFLASCRFVAKKNLFALLEAYQGYRSVVGAPAWDLVLLGGGPLETDLRAAIVGARSGRLCPSAGFSAVSGPPGLLRTGGSLHSAEHHGAMGTGRQRGDGRGPARPRIGTLRLQRGSSPSRRKRISLQPFRSPANSWARCSRSPARTATGRQWRKRDRRSSPNGRPIASAANCGRR